MATTPIQEIHLGKTDTPKNVSTALQEITDKLNEIIRKLNTLLP